MYVQPGIELVSLRALDDWQFSSRCGCGYVDRASPYPEWKNNASRSVVYQEGFATYVRRLGGRFESCVVSLVTNRP